ncbi:hypothetical protein SAMN05216311_109280 [Chitinophaga sp. CF418]|nr:hypothetical protein SAMN05216311_109280 [Chitinophaga sp. CF418]
MLSASAHFNTDIYTNHFFAFSQVLKGDLYYSLCLFNSFDVTKWDVQQLFRKGRTEPEPTLYPKLTH